MTETRRKMLGSFAALVLLAAPSARADDPPTHPNESLVVAGAITGAIGYGAAALTAFTYLFIAYPIPGLICHAADPGTCGLDGAEIWPFLPLAGPFLSAQAYKTPEPNVIRVFRDSPGLRSALYADGVIQVIGAGLLVAGLLDREPDKRPRQTAPASWILLPAPTVGGLGVRAIGSF